MKKQLVVMIGYRGSGKSTLAKALAEKIQWKYEISDQFIEREVGPLSQWIPQQGWSAFREREHKVCKILSRHIDAVIDLGGGCRRKSRKPKTVFKTSSYSLDRYRYGNLD